MSYKNKMAEAIDICEHVKIIVPSFEKRMEFVIEMLQGKKNPIKKKVKKRRKRYVY